MVDACVRQRWQLAALDPLARREFLQTLMGTVAVGEALEEVVLAYMSRPTSHEEVST